jgi:glycosyltransferase involved in cell wall biosynthesis
VADVADKRFRPARRYDLVLSHRGDLTDPEGLLDGATRVYLATGINHFVHNRNVRARYQALQGRRGCRLDLPSPHTEELAFIRRAHAIAGFGSPASVSTWTGVADVPVFQFNNYGYSSTRSTIEAKDFSKARMRFFFFASRDQVAKGLDILLEVFVRHPELELFVCSAFRKEPAFVHCYRRELFHTPNIHAIGLVAVNSEQFYDLTTRTGHVIHPSCSDATPGSVVQCMHTGLIPMVTKECGMELEGVGTLFADDSPSTIEQAIVEAAARPEEWYAYQARKTRQLAVEAYSEEAFIGRWKEIAKSLASFPLKGGKA